MNWKKALIIATLTGMMAFAVAGCGKSEEVSPAATQPAPTAQQPSAQQPAPADKTAPNIDDTRPAPPTDNGTMPAPPNGGVPGEKPAAPAIDYAAAAAKLGVTETQLREALGESNQGPPDMAAVAKALGVSEEALQEALGLPAGSHPPGGLPQDSSQSPTQVQ
jgi:hypothetical protein